MSLQQAFESVAAARSHKTALVVGTRRVTYGALVTATQVLTQRLRRLGIGAGERVVIFVSSPALYAVAVHAVLAAGAACAPLPAGARAARVAFALRDLRAGLLLTEGALQSTWTEALAGAEPNSTPKAADPLTWPSTIDALAFAACPLRPPPSPSAAPAPPGDLAFVLYTSGTTGVAKGAMLTHTNMRSAWGMVQAWLALHEDDVIALPLAPTFSYGLYYLLMGLGLGATVLVEPAQAFPRVLLQRLAHERATVLPGVPMLFSALLGGGAAEFDLASLRIVTNAAAALPPAHLERMADQWSRARILSMYGMTECKRISWLPPEEIARRPASVGRGMAGQEHWLIDEAGHRLDEAKGQLGELVVRGPHVMAGYWERPAETAERLGRDAGGVCLRTGDLFRSDAEGFLYFVARRDDIIKSRGEKVSPREVESVICVIPGVREAAVVGVPDPILGQAVKAYVVVNEGAALEPRHVIRHCLASLESYMAPKEVQFVPELPRTESGKLRRADLAAAMPPENPAADPAVSRSSAEQKWKRT